MRLDLWSRAVLLASLTAVLACDSGGSSKKKSCEDGATQSCECEDGKDGSQTCEKSEFAACVCAPPSDSGPGGDGGEDLGRLKGRVFDAETGRAVDDADLKTLSGETAKSDAMGNFVLKADKDPGDVEVSKTSYAATVKRPPPKGGYMEVFIKDEDNKTEFDAEKGVKVVLDSGASVDIPPGAVKDAEGKSVKGTVTLTVADVDGNDRKQGAALPELKGERGTDKGRVSVHRAMNIKIVDKDNKSLTVGKEDKVIAEFPAKSAGAAERSGLSFDEKKGAWVEEGKAKRTLNDKGEPVYRKDVDHLSWHGYGDFFATITCLRVCVRDGDANALPGAQVWLVGASFPGVSTLFTGDDGCVSGDAPAAQDVILVGQIEGGVSPALNYKTSDAVGSAETDPAACDTGAAPLVIGDATPGSCPSGFAECDGACSDPATDGANCGACGTVCGGPAGRAQACVGGRCGCPAGLSPCGDACVDLQNDPLNCGACGVNVNANLGPDVPPHQCVAGVPVPLLCGDTEAFCGGECVDVYNNEAHCGECGTVCNAGGVCLGGTCRDLTDQNLCTNNPQALAYCEDDLFCNGASTCNPQSNLADYMGCVRGEYPCSQQGATCDEKVDMCVPACVATNYVKETNRCAASLASGCLSPASGGDDGTKLSNALACGVNDSTPAADPNQKDELGQEFDCESCLRNEMMVCARDYGCEVQANDLDCCVQATTCTGLSCIQQACPDQFSALDSCLNKQVQNSRCYDLIVASNCL